MEEGGMVFGCLLIATLCLMVLLSLRNLLAVYENIQYFIAARSYKIRKRPAKFYIIVPLMDEVDSVGMLVDSLTSFNYPADRVKIVLATTVRERNGQGINPTQVAAEQIANTYRTKKNMPQIMAIECTKTNGYVATQIKFAVDHLGHQIHADDFLLVYNADSSPSKDTLLAADTLIQQYGSSINVMQQSSLFTKNIEAMLQKKRFSGVANAIHQSLWTLKHEVSMTRRQSEFSRLSLEGASVIRRLWVTRFTVCVGHGLFIRKSYYDQHPLNEDASIEDTHYGLYQSLSRTGVYTIPTLENSESPSTLKRVIAQKRTWFNLVFDLGRLLAKRGSETFMNREGRSEFLGILTQVAAIYIIWFTHSLFLVGSIILAFMAEELMIIVLVVFFYALYWLVPALLLAHYHKKLVEVGRLRSVDVMFAWILGLPAIFSHSIGPWLAVIDKVRGTNTRKKTER